MARTCCLCGEDFEPLQLSFDGMHKSCYQFARKQAGVRGMLTEMDEVEQTLTENQRMIVRTYLEKENLTEGDCAYIKAFHADWLEKTA